MSSSLYFCVVTFSFRVVFVHVRLCVFFRVDLDHFAFGLFDLFVFGLVF